MHVPVSWPEPHHTSLARQQHSLDTTGGVCPLQLWDDLCEALRVREISTEDVSNKASCCRLCCLPGCCVGTTEHVPGSSPISHLLEALREITAACC